MKSKHLSLLLMATLCLFFIGCSSSKYNYEEVPNDPLNTKIYTLDNGLKVFMSVNKETPRIQTFIAVKVGGKNDPKETTGLAHYFEHLMFKGTKQFGTYNYASEEPILDEIEKQFEVYRNTTNNEERNAIYHIIDSLSYEASKFAIPNEYDKLMTAIGSTGTNAYTGYDQTVYVENIPSNQVENWAKIQADRFENSIIRGFHTELETVYEEKNMSLTRDSRKVTESIFNSLYPHHPYGTQTVLGTQEHLKNPSISKIKEYYKTWYVPNNMAICLSGDFDPDAMVEILEKYFGHLQPNPNLPKLTTENEQEINSPIVRTVLGPEAENVTLSWRFPAINHTNFAGLEVLSYLLYNGTAGLIDLNLNQQQKVLMAYAGIYNMADASAFLVQARPKEGQTLDEVKSLVLEQIEELRSGKFDENELKAVINNIKLEQMNSFEKNQDRADYFVGSFINDLEWKEVVARFNNLSNLTVEQIKELANTYLKDTNYALIYKRTGVNPDEVKMPKPKITPIVMNRDSVSSFLKEVQASEVTPIEPVFLDYEKDLTHLSTKDGLPIIYKQNATNDLFQLFFYFDLGKNQFKELSTAFNYFDYVGTSKMSAEEIKKAFYQLACNYYFSAGNESTYFSISGLQENMEEALKLVEHLISDAQVDTEAYTSLVADILQSRSNAKLNQGQNFSRLTSYAIWGDDSPDKNIQSEDELKATNPESLLQLVKSLRNYEHKVLYYGPTPSETLSQIIEKEHLLETPLQPVPESIRFMQQETTKNEVLIAPYNAQQIYLGMYSNQEELYNTEIESARSLYNEYFGGGMNSIVFQEMRESRGLAYSAWAGLSAPNKLKYPYTLRAQIATQNDKMMDAIDAFYEIIENMPLSESAFTLAKEGLLARIRTNRIIKSDIIWNYLNAEDLGIKEDKRKVIFNEVQKMTLQDVLKFHDEWIKNRKYTYFILGNQKDLDLKSLEKIGPVKHLTSKDIFGF